MISSSCFVAKSLSHLHTDTATAVIYSVGELFKFQGIRTLPIAKEPFCPINMLALAPHATEEHENSRQMETFYFVHYGQVDFEVGTPIVNFEIKTGSLIKVPRGK